MLLLIKRNFLRVLMFYISFQLPGCKKYLDEKSNQRLIIPSTVQDLQSLLDNNSLINQRDPSAGETSSDDYYLSSTDFLALNETERNMYMWQKSNLFDNGVSNDWSRIYTVVNRANQVLAGIDNIHRVTGDEADWRNAKGHAFFLRGRSFLFAVSLWSLAYDAATAASDPGIPLKLTPNLNELPVRASVKESYEQAINDLKQAAELLPVTAIHVTRPSKAAALGMLARSFLWMRLYDSCFKYAGICLQIKSDLKNYNELTATATFPFSTIRYTNPEDMANFIFNGPPGSLNQSRCKIDSLLYQSYNANDLRKKVFYKTNTGTAVGTYAFKGSYYGSAAIYDGITTAEVLLMRAECFARAGNKDAALNDLNTLLNKRWSSTVPYVPVTAANAADALSKVLQERRKELVMRGLRWMDIKRLNKDGAGIVLKRIINNQLYSLLPNDKRYALPIPEDVIALSGMQQNDR